MFYINRQTIIEAWACGRRTRGTLSSCFDPVLDKWQDDDFMKKTVEN